jgi:peptidyl-prolyl isomerase G (cyclophilin G)
MSNCRAALDIESSIGKSRVVIELYNSKCPKTCENFQALCSGNAKNPQSGTRLCYQGSEIHRIIAPEYLIQGGDTVKNGGSLGDSIFGSSFKSESIGEDPMTEPGLLCMACDESGNCASQFFITLSETPWLSDSTGVFGKVVQGLEGLKKLGELEVDDNDRPLEPVTIVWTARMEKRKKETREFVMEGNLKESKGKTGNSHSRSRSRSPARTLESRKHERRSSHEQERRDPATSNDSGRRRDDREVRTENRRGDHGGDRGDAYSRDRPERRKNLYDQHYRDRGSDVEKEIRESLENKSYARERYSRQSDRDSKRNSKRHYGELHQHANRRQESDSRSADSKRVRTSNLDDDTIVFKGRGAMKFRERKPQSGHRGTLSYD